MQTSPARHDVIILGGGASGLMCAREAGLRGRRTLVLDHNPQVGKKIAISGGGRCNFTHAGASAENYLSSNPDFCRSALSRFTPGDFLALLDQRGIGYHEKQPGQFFCNTGARDIVDFLHQDCLAAGVSFLLNCKCLEIRRNTVFTIETNRGVLCAPSLVVATGGLSHPKIGATDLGHRIALQFGLKVLAPQPALVPLRWAKEDRDIFGALSGISFPVAARCGKTIFKDQALLTHRSISGPAILQISSYWNPGDPLILDLHPDGPVLPRLLARAGGAEEPGSVLGEFLPRRFARVWCRQQNLARPMNLFRHNELETLARRIHSWTLHPSGDEGFEKAEVTRGGVDTRALSSRTMEAREIPGLFFAGEALDITGWLGGYNLQWAWASGAAAGRAA
ncbi:MAG: aminoacetone oxidase family FAD-binding enzyme [Verrucomicrobiae bacterium]|nr:aminoacetone oxidase family FAD-binding enzyme [Verrucomicrobiae bacterium]